MKKSKAKKGKKPTTSERALALELSRLKKQVEKLASAKPEEKTIRIERPRLEGGDNPRNPMKHAKRAYYCDGTHVYLRRKKANPGIIDRIAKQIKAGDLKHVRTDDGVETYAVDESSPLKRKHLSLQDMTPMQLEQQIIQAACKRDWRLYYDAVSEMAYQYKNSLPANTADLAYQSTMQYLHLRIGRRGGPNDAEINRELKNVRAQRSGTQIFLMPDSNVERS